MGKTKLFQASYLRGLGWLLSLASHWIALGIPQILPPLRMITSLGLVGNDTAQNISAVIFHVIIGQV